MARKKKKSGSHRPKHHGRRVGAIKHEGLMSDAMSLVGLVGGTVVATAVQRHMTSISPKIISGIQIVGGIMLKSHFPSPLMQGVGWGVASAGAIGVASEFGVIHGIDQICDKMFNAGRNMIDAGGQQTQPTHVMVPVVVPGGGTTMAPVPIAQAKAMGYTSAMPNVSGLSNYPQMSGLSNYPQMSGTNEDMLREEYNSIQSLGM